MAANLRSETFDDQNVGTYHCSNRCVRRAYICGEDKLTGQNFDHRKEWIHSRLKQLNDIFAIDVLSYSVTSTHIHVLIKNRPDLAREMSDVEVLERWWDLYPKKSAGITKQQYVEAYISQSDFIEEHRARLSSISWFMRTLCEPIARRANKEDQVTGRFWEGQFISKRVLDAEGVLATSVYVDLNPIKGKLAETLEQTEHASICDRIKTVTSGQPPELVVPIRQIMEGMYQEAPFLLEDESDYVDYVRLSAEALVRRQLQTPKHLKLVESHASVVGAPASIAKEAVRRNKKWLRRSPLS